MVKVLVPSSHDELLMPPLVKLKSEEVGSGREVRRDVGGIGTDVEVLGPATRHGQEDNGAEHRGEWDGAFHRVLFVRPRPTPTLSTESPKKEVRGRRT